MQIGRNDGLSGMLTLPLDLETSRPVFVILNAGLLHRVGPYRLHVQCARRLARQGLPVLRLDLSGLGYSAPDPDRQGLDAALADCGAVFDWLESSYSLQRPVLMGSCSGADMAHRIAVVDERVRGCVFLDGYAYQNAQSVVSYYAARVHRKEVWSDWLAAHLKRTPQQEAPGDDDESFWDSEYPPLEQFRSELAAFVAREMPLLYVYTGSVREYNYESQLFDVCPEAREGPVSVRYFPRASHTYMLERDRLMLLDEVRDWAATSWPGEDRG